MPLREFCIAELWFAEAPHASTLGEAPYASTPSLMSVLKNTWPGGHLPAQVGMLQPP